jgi:hypothetical protein
VSNYNSETFVHLGIKGEVVEVRFGEIGYHGLVFSHVMGNDADPSSCGLQWKLIMQKGVYFPLQGN